MQTQYFDVVIAGGGIIGCSSAYYLVSNNPELKVVVVEMDPTYSNASTALSLANIRIQFSLEKNIRISQYAFQVLKRFKEDMSVKGEKPDLAFHQEGNFFLIYESGRNVAEKALLLQKKLGSDVEWLSAEKIRSRYPLYEPSPYSGGSFSPKDGHIDAYAFLMGYRRKARAMGVKFINDKVISLDKSYGQITGAHLESGQKLSSRCVVNCAGAWASQVAASAGINIPVIPVKRQVFVLETEVKPDTPLPLTVLPSGLYFRSEIGGKIILGKSLKSDQVGINFSWDRQRFIDLLWPELAEFIPSFDSLKLVRGWAGLYAVNTFDGNAILGEWPELKGLYLANGFSGHGMQQAPAVGRYISELITGKTPELDLSTFSPERLLEDRPLAETGLV
jgi:glycine/D-amino acid oxidase-like deaminating enzyme